MKKNLRMASSAMVMASALLLVISIAAPAYGQTLAAGHWVMTQAAAQSRGAAPSAIACGEFALDVTSSTGRVFTGSISFSLTNSIPNGLDRLTIPGINGAPEESVTGTILTPPNGALFVSFSGDDPVPLFGSFASPSFQPSPSIDPTELGCPAITSGGFLGLLHLPGQGTEGMTIFGYQ